MKMLGVLLAVLLVLAAPISRVGVNGTTSESTKGTEIATLATDTTEPAIETATEAATMLVTEAVTLTATEPTVPSSASTETEVESAELTVEYISESAYAETECDDSTETEITDSYATGYYSGYSDYDRELLARAIYAEAGCSWIPDYVQLSVGSVVLNRVQSGYYPDTIEGVLYDPGQYVPSTFYATEPDERAYRNADILLNGGSTLPANVLGQNGWGIGDEIYDTYYDEVLGTTIYFTYIY